MVATGILFVTTAALAFQHAAVPLVVTSDAVAPIVLSGTVSVGDTVLARMQYSYEARLSARNASNKSILLYIMQLDVTMEGTGDRKLTRTEDYFFRPDLFQPDTIQTWIDRLPPFPDAPTAAVADHPTPIAKATLMFVQFADGSTWGNARTAENSFEQRHSAMQRLSFLAETYRERGEEQFIKELMMPSQVPLVLGLQRLYKTSNNDASDVITRLYTLLNNAEVHQREMQRAGPDSSAANP